MNHCMGNPSLKVYRVGSEMASNMGLNSFAPRVAHSDRLNPAFGRHGGRLTCC